MPLEAYKWLVCFLLEKSQKRLQQQRAMGQDRFEAFNNSQVRHRHTHIYTVCTTVQLQWPFGTLYEKNLSSAISSS